MIRIAVDVYGGDNAPGCVIDGALEALRAMDDVSILFCGAQAEVEGLLNGREYDAQRVSIVDAPDIITNHESPTLAIRRKLNSSMVRAMDLVKKGEADAVVTAGSTGAALAGGIFRMGRIRGIDRPALGPLLPTSGEYPVILIDCGANADCKPDYLVQFALMGQAYMKGVMGIANPKVGLLNVGAEDEKGNELCKAVFPLLKDHPGVNFYGNVEARDVLTGVVQVIVCDGFSGNILLKSTEGAAHADLRQAQKKFDVIHTLQAGRADGQACAQDRSKTSWIMSSTAAPRCWVSRVRWSRRTVRPKAMPMPVPSLRRTRWSRAALWESLRSRSRRAVRELRDKADQKEE